MANILNMVPQRRDWDCAIAALSSLTGVPYEEVLAAAARVAACERGLYQAEIVKVAEELGVTLKKKRRVNHKTDTGILRVWSDRKVGGGAHAVVLWEGRVLNPHGYVVHVAEYLSDLARKGWKPGALLVRDE